MAPKKIIIKATAIPDDQPTEPVVEKTIKCAEISGCKRTGITTYSEHVRPRPDHDTLDPIEFMRESRQIVETRYSASAYNRHWDDRRDCTPDPSLDIALVVSEKDFDIADRRKIVSGSLRNQDDLGPPTTWMPTTVSGKPGSTVAISGASGKAWAVKFRFENTGEARILHLDATSRTVIELGMNVSTLTQAATFGIRKPDIALFHECVIIERFATDADVDPSPERFYLGGKGTAECYVRSIKTNTNVHPDTTVKLSKIGPKGVAKYFKLAAEAYAGEVAKADVPSLTDCIEDFLSSYNPKARSGPKWAGTANLRKVLGMEGKGQLTLGELINYELGDLIRYWKHHKFPVTEDEAAMFLARAPAITPAELAWMEACYLVPKDERLPLTKRTEKTRVYGVHGAAANAIAIYLNSLLAKAMPTVLSGGSKGPGCDYESGDQPSKLLARMSTPGVNVAIMGDDVMITDVSAKGKKVRYANIDTRACDFSLTSTEVMGAMLGQIELVGWTGEDRLFMRSVAAWLLGTYVRMATQGLVAVQGQWYVRPKGMISGIGGTSDNDYRVMMWRLGYALEGHSALSQKWWERLEEWAVLKTKETHECNIADLWEHLDWISHKFQKVQHRGKEHLIFNPGSRKLLAAMYAHPYNTTLGAEPDKKVAVAYGIVAQFPEDPLVYSLAETMFTMACGTIDVRTLPEKAWRDWVRSFIAENNALDASHARGLMAWLKRIGRLPTRDALMQAKYTRNIEVVDEEPLNVETPKPTWADAAEADDILADLYGAPVDVPADVPAKPAVVPNRIHKRYVRPGAEFEPVTKAEKIAAKVAERQAQELLGEFEVESRQEIRARKKLEGKKEAAKAKKAASDLKAAPAKKAEKKGKATPRPATPPAKAPVAAERAKAPPAPKPGKAQQPAQAKPAGGLQDDGQYYGLATPEGRLAVMQVHPYLKTLKARFLDTLAHVLPPTKLADKKRRLSNVEAIGIINTQLAKRNWALAFSNEALGQVDTDLPLEEQVHEMRARMVDVGPLADKLVGPTFREQVAYAMDQMRSAIEKLQFSYEAMHPVVDDDEFFDSDTDEDDGQPGTSGATDDIPIVLSEAQLDMLDLAPVDLTDIPDLPEIAHGPKDKDDDTD